MPHGFNLITAYGSTARLIATRIRSIWLPIDNTIYYNIFRIHYASKFIYRFMVQALSTFIREAANDVNIGLSINVFFYTHPQKTRV